MQVLLSRMMAAAAMNGDAAPSEQQNASNAITEDEAALYDRQIRLWGVEAQNRMRSASVLVVNMRGLATEVCKNIVLAGIGQLTILDDADVTEEDLGCGFFLREADVGQKRSSAARPRVNALNPRVEVIASQDTQILHDEKKLSQYDLVVLTDSHKDEILRLNELCRRIGKKFYAGGSFGLHGYIFADLLEHEWITEQPQKPAAGAPPSADIVKVTLKRSQSFVPFEKALEHKWSGLSAKKLKKLNPILPATLVLWEYQYRNSGQLPSSEAAASVLRKVADEILPAFSLNSSLLPQELLETLATTASMEFMPVCAILGGMLGQDALNTLGGREPPVINLFTFDGTTGAGDIHQLGLKLQT